MGWLGRWHVMLLGVAGTLLSAAIAGCERPAPKAAPAAPPVIPVSQPITREIVDYVYYTGRTDAVQSVDIRARVSGYITQLPFKEGAEVKAGDLLFEIDPRPYQSQLAASEATLALRQANYNLSHSENARSRAIARNTEGAISAEALEKSQSLEAQALAELSLAKANLGMAKLDLEYTRVTSPIDGHISRYYYTLGNLVTQDQTPLTSVVSVDPMYAYFEMDERTVLRIRMAINAGKIVPHKNQAEISVNMRLEGEEGYPHHGTLNFVNNTVSLSTGTITVRAVFPNPLPPGGRRLMTPGMFVRIQLPVGQPHSALLITERALSSDQGVKFVYVINAQNKAEYRRVKPGSVQEDGLVPIDEGLKPEDWVVVGGLPQVRTKMVVEPEKTAMPNLINGMGLEDQTPPAVKAPPPSTPAPSKTVEKGKG